MFSNREEAGIRLSLVLSQLKNLDYPVAVSIPRGGVIIGDVISKILQIPHYSILVKKISSPNNPELAIGAAGFNGEVFWDEELINHLNIDQKTRDFQLSKTTETIALRKEKLGMGEPNVSGRVVFLVDDGVATGSTAIAAFLALKKQGASRVILATPVVAKHIKKDLEKYFDKVVSVLTPSSFRAVGQFYKEFPQVEDSKVKELLNQG